MDQTVFFLINSIRSPAIDTFMDLGTRLGSFLNMLWLVAFFCGLLLLNHKSGKPVFSLNRQQLTELLATLIIGYILCGLVVSALKFGLQMPRPFMLYGSEVMHSTELPDSPFSFPSGHSAFAMLVAASLWRFSTAGIKFFLFGFVLWVGISRVNLGMHFPSDVMVGYLAGLVAAWCSAKISQRYFNKSKT